jgi:hypothetical protein
MGDKAWRLQLLDWLLFEPSKSNIASQVEPKLT